MLCAWLKGAAAKRARIWLKVATRVSLSMLECSRLAGSGIGAGCDGGSEWLSVHGRCVRA
jgi:hypothetical protein